MTQPIKYAKHKSNTRVWLTIVFVWVFSGLVASPIVLGLNTPLGQGVHDPTSCIFHNYYFIFFSSLCSFYIPCTILVYLYYRIFKVSTTLNIILMSFVSSSIRPLTMKGSQRSPILTNYFNRPLWMPNMSIAR